MVKEPNYKSLFHFQGPNLDWLNLALRDRKIWFSNPASFNDPWDCRPAFSPFRDYSKNEREYVKAKYEQVAKDRAHNRFARRSAITRSMRPAQIQAALQEIETGMGNAICNEWGIYCLSQKNNIPLLWSHYAKSHQGVCLEFSVENDYFSQSQEVHYSNSPNFIKISDSNKIASRKAFLTKASYWCYEHEHRLILPTRKNEIISKVKFSDRPAYFIDNDGYSEFPLLSLIGIIFGARSSQEFKHEVRAMAQRTNWSGRFYQATVSRGSYEIVIKPAP